MGNGGLSCSRSPYTGLPQSAPEESSDVPETDKPPDGVETEAWNRALAAGTAMQFLRPRDNFTTTLETNSVYGAALILPQVSRTADHSIGFTAVAMRAYVLLVLNVVLQGFLLYMICKEERIVSKFAGQMRLCDFAAGVADCPDTANCVGPGGTLIDSTRLYDFNLWSTRVYVRDSLKILFPDKIDEINEHVDPGEYGVESYYLRFVSVFLFIMGLWHDLKGSWAIAILLFKVPTASESWMTYEVPACESKERVKQLLGCSELDFVKFRVAGMPMKWKLINVVFVLLPKLYLWLLAIDIGTVFLMETAAIEDMIINAVALGFILDIDELICLSLMSETSKHILTNTAEPVYYDIESMENASPRLVFELHQKNKRWSWCGFELWWRVVPGRLVVIVMTTAFFISKYYSENCMHQDDGSWVAKDVNRPLSDKLAFASFIFGPFPTLFPVLTQEESVWTMPDAIGYEFGVEYKVG